MPGKWLDKCDAWRQPVLVVRHANLLMFLMMFGSRCMLMLGIYVLREVCAAKLSI